MGLSEQLPNLQPNPNPFSQTEHIIKKKKQFKYLFKILFHAPEAFPIILLSPQPKHPNKDHWTMHSIFFLDASLKSQV